MSDSDAWGSEGDGQYLADPQPIYANRRMRWNDIQRARRAARIIRIVHLLLLQFNIHWINIRQQWLTDDIYVRNSLDRAIRTSVKDILQTLNLKRRHAVNRYH